VQGSINFALYSSNAHSVELCFFTETDLRAGKLTHSIKLDPGLNKSGDIWHIQIPGLREELLYGEPASLLPPTTHSLNSAKRVGVTYIIKHMLFKAP
jgi:pullulanase/glycogen debranching enzyme